MCVSLYSLFGRMFIAERIHMIQSVPGEQVTAFVQGEIIKQKKAITVVTSDLPLNTCFNLGKVRSS